MLKYKSNRSNFKFPVKAKTMEVISKHVKVNLMSIQKKDLFYCDHCKFYSKNESNVKSHILVNHTRENVPKYKSNKSNVKKLDIISKHVKVDFTSVQKNIDLIYCDQCNYAPLHKHLVKAHIFAKHRAQNIDATQANT